MEQDAPAVLVDAARLPVPSSRGPSPAPSCATTTAATTTAATTTAAAATTTTATNASGGEAKKKEKWCKHKPFFPTDHHDAFLLRAVRSIILQMICVLHT